MPREVDPFRRHVEAVANKWKCKFCGKDFGGSATGIRAHPWGLWAMVLNHERESMSMWDPKL